MIIVIEYLDSELISFLLLSLGLAGKSVWDLKVFKLEVPAELNTTGI